LNIGFNDDCPVYGYHIHLPAGLCHLKLTGQCGYRSTGRCALEVGAKQLVDGISEDRYKSGVFYASKEGKLSGEVVDQSTFYTDLKNTSFQDNADKAIHRFIKKLWI